MKSVLVYNDLWQYVDGTEVKPPENAQNWIRKDSKALALINLSISHSQLNYVKKAETAKEAWDCLKGIFESKGPVRKATLYKQLLRMEKESNATITQHVNDFTSKAGQLEEAGIQIPDELLSIMLLNSLPDEYKNFSVAMESRDDIPTLEVLKAKLKEEEARQNDRDAKTSDSDKKGDALLARGSANRGKQSRANPRDGSTKTSTQKFD
ncbi:retrovirus-related pol polyprotein from transposon tnt 1-94, partial [Lasius niger]